MKEPTWQVPALTGQGDVVEAAAEAVAGALPAAIGEEQMAVIKQGLQRLVHGAARAAPMMCAGTSCPFLSACPVHQARAPLPTGSPCPVESVILQIWVNNHLETLGIKDVLAAESSFDMQMLYELAHLELIRWRATVHLADEPAMIESKVVSYGPNGEPVYADLENPALKIMEGVSRQMMKIRDALLATRRAQVTAGQSAVDPTVRTAELLTRARERLRQRQEREMERLKDADFKVEDEQK